MPQPGSPASIIPAGDDYVVKRLQDLERTVKELSASVSATTTTIPRVQNFTSAAFSVSGPFRGDICSVGFTVPAGMTQCLALASGHAYVRNNSGVAGTLDAGITIGVVNGTVMTETIANGVSALISNSDATVLTGLVPGAHLPVSLTLNTTGALWAVDASNVARICAIAVFLR